MKSLTCWRVQRLLPAHAADQLSDSEARRTERHLRQCSRCTEELRWHRLTRVALHGQPYVAAPDDFTQRAMVRFATVRRPRWFLAFIPYSPQLAQVGVLAALLYWGTSALRPPRSSLESLTGERTVAATESVAPVLAEATPPANSVVQAATSARPSEASRPRTPHPTTQRPTAISRTAPARPRSATAKPAAVKSGESLLRSSSALMTEREYQAALNECQEYVSQTSDRTSHRRARKLAGQLLAAAGDAALQEVLQEQPPSPPVSLPAATAARERPRSAVIRVAAVTEPKPAAGDPLTLIQRADALASDGADPTLVASRYREAQRALRQAIREQQTPQTLLALANACEAVSERDSAVEAYAQLVEAFPETVESQTAASRLAQLT